MSPTTPSLCFSTYLTKFLDVVLSELEILYPMTETAFEYVHRFWRLKHNICISAPFPENRIVSLSSLRLKEIHFCTIHIFIWL